MRFYVVMINVNPGLTVNDVQVALSNDIQWFRIANNVWVVHTIYGSDWLFNRLIGLANPSGALFISRLNPEDRRGWLDKRFWDWIEARIAQYGPGM